MKMREVSFLRYLFISSLIIILRKISKYFEKEKAVKGNVCV